MKKFSNVQSKVKSEMDSQRPQTAQSMRSKQQTGDKNHVAFGRSTQKFYEQQDKENSNTENRRETNNEEEEEEEGES